MSDTTFKTGMPVSFMKNNSKSIGEIIELPSENSDNVYYIKDFLLEEEVTVPQTALVNEVRSNEMFRVFVVQRKESDKWKDVKKYRDRDDAKRKKTSIDAESRIISEVFQV